jgi:hypothetical protein
MEMVNNQLLGGKLLECVTATPRRAGAPTPSRNAENAGSVDRIDIVAMLALLMAMATQSRANCQVCAGPHSPLANGTYLPCAPGNEPGIFASTH